ncbi:MAG: PIN domain-containing protein [Nitrososphaeria archaeon]
MKLFDTEVTINMIRTNKYEEGSISIITLIEFLRGISGEKRGTVKGLLEESFDIIWLDNDIIQIYCRIYQELKSKGELVPDADLLIAATAISKKLELVSNDIHFEKLIPFGLKLIK